MWEWAGASEGKIVADMAMEEIFLSSRRRHTRCKCDWSSDVWSSDLACVWGGEPAGIFERFRHGAREGGENGGVAGENCRRPLDFCAAPRGRERHERGAEASSWAIPWQGRRHARFCARKIERCRPGRKGRGLSGASVIF